jgi:DNA mismatch endonuclease (patch repair protein)
VNQDYWVPKLQRNKERDRLTDRRLGNVGWHVLRIWEHVPTEEAASAVEAAVNRRRPETRSKSLDSVSVSVGLGSAQTH